MFKAIEKRIQQVVRFERAGLQSLRRWKTLLPRFGRATGASIAMTGAVLFTTIAGASLFAADYARATQMRGALQRAADTAALSLARQLPFLISDSQTNTVPDETLTTIAKQMVAVNLRKYGGDRTTTATMIGSSRVRVSLLADYEPLIPSLDVFMGDDISVVASAESFGGEDICLISLGVNDGLPGIEASGSSQVTATNCGVYSSVKGPESLKLGGASLVDARLICAAGGYNGADSNTSQPVITDCQQIDDPLADRVAPPAAAACDYDEATYDGGTHTMEPGIYCGKTDLKNGADVTMNPGIYVFRDGELHTHDTSRLTGEGVGLYFDDKKALFEFMDTSMVDLSAPVDGPMAGVLLAARDLCPAGATGGNCSERRKFEISSTNVRRLLGTVHLPSDELIIDTDMPVSSEAAFTIVVVGSLTMENAPTLVLNTDYAATDVPVPQGFSGVGSSRIVE